MTGYATCPDCKGMGEFGAINPNICSMCGGAGTVQAWKEFRDGQWVTVVGAPCGSRPLDRLPSSDGGDR